MNERPARRCREWNPMPIEDVARGAVVWIECSSDHPDLIEPIPMRFDQIEDGPAGNCKFLLPAYDASHCDVDARKRFACLRSLNQRVIRFE
jgi:hypothetical protein